ncbi:GAF domain-containing protein [Achromobacter xylosoxidans]|uniref:GAF domain-containing protein n=1 Tax=Alcaligenes xylosoxydans xylosoxydans TaxID=85698 RepID=UPI000B495EAF|nr:GAF domain-containing protein [Achromobacter xylosoxidans]
MSGARGAAIQALDALARSHAEVMQPRAVFAAADHALAAAIGHRLFTILSYDSRTSLATRLYSNLPEAYPAGGSKTLAPGPWTETVLDRGEPYIGRTPADLQAVFTDHALIASLDCQSVLNMPIRWRGRTVGSLNLLHAAHWYGPDEAAACRPYAQLVLPALCCA